MVQRIVKLAENDVMICTEHKTHYKGSKEYKDSWQKSDFYAKIGMHSLEKGKLDIPVGRIVDQS